MKGIVFLGALSMAFLGLLGPVDAGAHVPQSSADCRCDAARLENGWCGACQTGYLAGVAIPSPALYEMVDPHGHDLNPTGISCPLCLEALECNGYCPSCEIGYVDGRGYVSRLAYLVASRAPPDSPELAAETGRLEAAVAWLATCELCGVAAFADGRCPIHRWRFRDGQVLDPRTNEKGDTR